MKRSLKFTLASFEKSSVTLHKDVETKINVIESMTADMQCLTQKCNQLQNEVVKIKDELNLAKLQLSERIQNHNSENVDWIDVNSRQKHTET